MNFCPNCGNELNKTSNFCANCGAGIKETSDPQTINTKISKNRRINYGLLLKVLIPVLISSALAAGVYKYFGNSNKIDMVVSLTSTDDFTFEADCQPTQIPDSGINAGLYIDFIGDELQEYVPMAGEWNRSSDNLCSFFTQIEKPREVLAYSLKFLADRQEIILADDSKFQQDVKSIEVIGEVGRMQSIKGILTISDNVSASKLFECQFAYLTGASKVCGKIKVDGLVDGYKSCSSATGDIASGKTIKILSENDRELASTRFQTDMLAFDVKMGPNETRDIECKLNFTAEVPVVKGSYRFIFGNQGEINYSYEELEENKRPNGSWLVRLNLG